MAIVLDGNNLTTNGLINSLPAQTASGLNVTFTGIPSTAKRVTLNFHSLVGSTSSTLLIQLGIGGGLVTSGYSTYGGYYGTSELATAYSNGWQTSGYYITNTMSGSMVFTSLGSNLWVGVGSWIGDGSAYIGGLVGRATLGGSLTTVNLTNAGGTGVFTGGTVNVFYE
jgi:hypothetical protein